MSNLNIYRRKRTLASVEDSKNYNVTLQSIARAAGEEAIVEAKVLKIPVTYLQGNQIVKKFPDGRIEVLGHLAESKTSKVLRKGTILHARKG